MANSDSVSSSNEDPALIPIAIRILRRFPRPAFISRFTAYRLYIFGLTYLLYVTFHVVRKPLGVTKNVLYHSNCSNVERPPDRVFLPNNTGWCSWAPFDRKDHQEKFAGLDFSYRLAYALGMVFAGHLGERLEVRRFLTVVMLVSGLWVVFGGLAFFWQVHSYSYFVVAQVGAGIFQSAGWPAVLTLMGNWFGKKRRGLIFGIWNTDTAVGNILGAIIAGVWVTDSLWGFSFIVPGIILSCGGIVAYCFVVVRPEDIGLSAPNYTGGDEPDAATKATVLDPAASTAHLSQSFNESSNDQLDMLPALPSREDRKPITIWGAILIPGVIEYAICLFFCKSVYYAFFAWLPVYIKDSLHVKNNEAADLSALFDGGGIVGGISAGLASDLLGGSATVCGAMFLLAIPAIFCLEHFIVTGGHVLLIILLLVIGFLLNGPYTLIVTAVSADLGTRPSLVKDKKCLTTVAAVIDAMGALGSACGPLIAGLLSKGREKNDWKPVFYYLIAAQLCAVLCLTRLIYREGARWWTNRNTRRNTRFQLKTIGLVEAATFSRTSDS
ncbi:Glucose-6-phosphate [Hypsibius exemplaris]|uniref:Sugar phosphate exchanger 3 n=1 Tax=Hypsibius exemplaris TaxID=2072580 RepID=A0A9X6NJU6_HYPEX|nr:Glucose-6-phosphate [Hypsibius exemplaris]